MKTNDVSIKASRREGRRKPRMPLHGRNLKKQSKFAGFALGKKRG